jgi:hypothetical protein
MSISLFGLNFNESQDFDGGALGFLVKHAKISGTNPKPIYVFYVFFPKGKTHNMLCMMLNPHYKGLGLIIQFLGKKRMLQKLLMSLSAMFCFHLLFLHTIFKPK